MEREPGHVRASGGGVTLRLFAALPVAPEAAAAFADHADVLADRMSAHVADPSNMHLTFAFLGDVLEDYVPLVARELDAAASLVPGPTLCSAAGMSPFGRGRVVAVDVDVELLAMLGSARDRFTSSSAHFAPMLDRRAWRPHVGVLRAPAHGTLPHAMLDQLPQLPPVRWIAPELRLYASLPGPLGRQHRVLHVAPLGVPARSR